MEAGIFAARGKKLITLFLINERGINCETVK
jgi:hypothetical protein